MAEELSDIWETVDFLITSENCVQTFRYLEFLDVLSTFQEWSTDVWIQPYCLLFYLLFQNFLLKVYIPVFLLFQQTLLIGIAGSL